MLSASLILLCACAGPKSNEQYEKLSKDKSMVCEHTASTGSHLKKRKCMSKDLADELRRQNQEAMRSQENKAQPSAGSSI